MVKALGVHTSLINKLQHMPAHVLADEIHRALTTYSKPAAPAPAATHDHYRAQWLPLYQRMNYLRHELDKLQTHTTTRAKERRRCLAFEVLTLEQDVNHFWALAAYHNTHGTHYQAPAIVPPADPVALARLINNTRRNLQRAHKANNIEKIKEHTATLQALHSAPAT